MASRHNQAVVPPGQPPLRAALGSHPRRQAPRPGGKHCRARARGSALCNLIARTDTLANPNGPGAGDYLGFLPMSGRGW